MPSIAPNVQVCDARDDTIIFAAGYKNVFILYT